MCCSDMTSIYTAKGTQLRISIKANANCLEKENKALYFFLRVYGNDINHKILDI